MKITNVQYLAYDRNRMYIGSFEDEEYAKKWAEKHGGYVDRHCIEREENRVYDDLLKAMVRKETAEKIQSEATEAAHAIVKGELVVSISKLEEICKKFTEA